jgi:hypothetical protein
MRAERALGNALDVAAVPVRFWWRDDDAGADDERMAALLRLAAARGAAVALAVVPGWLEPACRERVLAAPTATVLQHGIAHADHAVPPAKRIELGGSAARESLLAGLRHGRERLAASFGARFLPVLVPPWNRIAPDLAADLPGLGFVGLSTFGRRDLAEAVPGLRRVNTLLDLVRWREGARPLELEPALEGLARLAAVPGNEPIGILSHHRAMDSGAFAALDRILALVQDHPRATLAAAGALFGEGR